ncbi:MAG: branched-chain amino acid ABC transporter permease [Dehalococcoidales bacterium]|nr:branched-chain amino acid ABC transporter permease [Dehalococcoidales bacterium]
MTQFLDVFITGLINGGIYALIAMGMSLQYGVARVFNISHGEFIMIGALTTYTLYTVLHINPLLSVVISGPIIFAIGYLLHLTLFRYLKKKSVSAAAFEGNSLLATFGLMFIIQNIALIIWTSQMRGYSFLTKGISIFGAQFAANRLVALGVAVAVGVFFYLFLARTRIGKAIRAASQDPDVAGLMGVNINTVLALCFGLGALMAGIAGLLISIYLPAIHPTIGAQYTFIAIIVVALGGLGSIPGSFIGGFILGIVGSIVTFFEPGLALVSYYLIFMVLLIVRPKGIFGK